MTTTIFLQTYGWPMNERLGDEDGPELGEAVALGEVFQRGSVTGLELFQGGAQSPLDVRRALPGEVNEGVDGRTSLRVTRF